MTIQSTHLLVEDASQHIQAMGFFSPAVLGSARSPQASSVHKVQCSLGHPPAVDYSTVTHKHFP